MRVGTLNSELVPGQLVGSWSVGCYLRRLLIQVVRAVRIGPDSDAGGIGLCGDMTFGSPVSELCQDTCSAPRPHGADGNRSPGQDARSSDGLTNGSDAHGSPRGARCGMTAAGVGTAELVSAPLWRPNGLGAARAHSLGGQTWVRPHRGSDAANQTQGGPRPGGSGWSHVAITRPTMGAASRATGNTGRINRPGDGPGSIVPLANARTTHSDS